MNIKKLLSDFGIWIFTGLTFIGIVLIYVGLGKRGRYDYSGTTNWYFVGIGIVLMLPFLFYLIKTKFKLKKLIDEDTNRINELIKTGNKITVDLNELEIRTNSYKQEISVGSGYQERNEHIDIDHNVIILDIPYQDVRIRYKLDIDMEPTTLKMHFAIKKETEIYIDPKNPNNNYLDLSFLDLDYNRFYN